MLQLKSNNALNEDMAVINLVVHFPNDLDKIMEIVSGCITQGNDILREYPNIIYKQLNEKEFNYGS